MKQNPVGSPNPRSSCRRFPKKGPEIGSFVLIVLMSCVFLPISISSAEGVRAKVEKWAEASQIASKESAEWRVEKETLRATRDLLKQERDALQQEIESLQNSDAGASQERQDLLVRSQGYDDRNGVLVEKIERMERQVRDLVPALPAPLVAKLEPLLIQIPEEGAATRTPASARLMNILGILSQADKFDSTASFVGETRSVDGGERKVSVRTLYWGLAQAVYVDAEGKVAGFGRPSDGGWTFEDEPNLNEKAALLLDIYEGNTDAIEFINLPVEVR